MPHIRHKFTYTDTNATTTTTKKVREAYLERDSTISGGPSTTKISSLKPEALFGALKATSI
jgi:hypothetical protein